MDKRKREEARAKLAEIVPKILDLLDGNSSHVIMSSLTVSTALMMVGFEKQGLLTDMEGAYRTADKMLRLEVEHFQNRGTISVELIQ